jgi:hypothetical protein
LVDGWPAVIGGVAALFVAVTFPMIASVGLGGRCLAHDPKRPCPGDVGSDVAFVLGITIASVMLALVLLTGTRWRKLFVMQRRRRWKRSWRRTTWAVIGVILGLVSLLTLDAGPMILAVCCAILVVPRRLARNARRVRLLDDGVEAQRWLRKSRYLAWNEIDAVTARDGYLAGETGSWVRLRGFDRSQDVVLTTWLPHFQDVVGVIRARTTSARTQPPGWISEREPRRPGHILVVPPKRPIRALILQLVAGTVSPLLWISALRAFGPTDTGALVLVATLIVLLYVYVRRVSRQ